MAIQPVEPHKPGELFAQFKAGEALDLGIDVAAQRRLSNVLVASILGGASIPGLVFGCESDESWVGSTREDLLDCAATICDLLSLRPQQAGGKRLTARHLWKVAALGFGPSSGPYYGDEIESITDLQNELGWEAHPLVRFRNWTQTDCLKKAKQIFPGKPTKEAIRLAAREGKFPGESTVRDRFGTVLNFYELLGYVDAWGWDKGDYLDWGVAFKMQNGLGVSINQDVLSRLDRHRRPSATAVTRHFGIVNLDIAATEGAINKQKELADYRGKQIEITEELCAANAKLAAHLADADDAKRLRVSGQYRLVEELLSQETRTRRNKIAFLGDGDKVARAILRINEPIEMTMAEVESTASELEVFDIIWPMNTYRFQHVDLSIAA